jgi:probable F420-dependent oxidoreductase
MSDDLNGSTNALSGARERLGRIGVWSGQLRPGDPGLIAEAAAELDELGFGAIWIPDPGGDMFGPVEALLAGTRRMTIATGVMSVWRRQPAEIGGWWRALPAERQARLMLGFGISHAHYVGEGYGRPLATMRTYLDGLDAEGVPAERRCLAALGPRMLDLAREPTAGAHPYLITAEHTASARERLGPEPLLAPEVGVVLETDRATAHAIAAKALAPYMRLPNYVNNWRRLGFSEADVTGPSPRLIDALFAWGGIEQVAEQVKAHLEAGADHVCLQVFGGGDGAAMPRQAWRELAAALV